MTAETLIGLVKQYSPSGQEAGAVDWLLKRMQALGFDSIRKDESGNAVGVMGSGPKQLVLMGHIDTVPGEIKVEQIGNLLYGRGSVDAKGPLAAFTDAVAQVGVMDGWQFVVIGAIDEERDSVGARHAVTQYRPDYAIIGEPNRWERVSLGYKGSAWAEITVRREMAHSASGKETACEAAVETWNRVQAWAAEFNTGREKAFERVLPTLRGMQSEQDDFEQRACLNIGTRLPVDLPPNAWYERLAELAGDDEMKPAGYAMPAWQCEKNTPLVRAFLAAIRARGGTPGFVYKTGTADLNIAGPAWGCPMLVYGPGDSALDHTPNEHLDLEEYERSVQVLSDVLRALTSV
jgi:LysW-gamma-L-lysine carboxypeptidase